MAFIMSLDIKPVKFFPNQETKAWFWIKDLVSSVLWCCQGASQPLKHVALLLLSCQFKNRSRDSRLSQLLMMFLGAREQAVANTAGAPGPDTQAHYQLGEGRHFLSKM